MSLFPTKSLACSSLGALLLAGCAAGPDYEPPQTPASIAGPFVSEAKAQVTSDPLPPRWWELYADADLNRLVELALSKNTDLRAALARLEQARGVLSEVRGDRLPQTQVSGGALYRKGTLNGRGNTGLTGTGVNAVNPSDDDAAGMTYAGGFDVAYEVDLFGRIGRRIEAARADAEAEAAATDGVRVTVAAETTRAYIGACAAAERLNVARRNQEVAARTLELARRQVRLGVIAQSEVAGLEAQERDAAAAIPPIVDLRRAALFNLALLTGATPGEVDPAARACMTPPRLSAPLPTGDGRDLLARRPDVREAERRLAAQTARIGIATADLYPRIALGGSLLSSGSGLGDATSSSGLSFSLGPLISWSFPNVQKARARIAQEEAGTREALARFDGAWLGALNETERALTAYATASERNTALRQRARAEKRRFAIVEASARLGATKPLERLDAERTLLAARRDLAASDAQVLDRGVTLFKALGGGWQARP